jgi:nitrogen-specific signal transduction histidine kinase
MSRFEPSFKTELWHFLLLRTLHDLGNSISGILTLSTHHLRNELPSEEVAESFKLIRESAESARQMLMAIGSLTDEESQGPELVRVSDFLHDLMQQLQIIVPRSVNLQLESDSSDAVIEVDQNHLRQAFVMLVAADCLSFGARAGNIRFGEETKSGKIWIVYSSEHKMDFDHSRRSAEIFEKLNLPPGDLIWSETEEELKVKIGFLPVADLATEMKGVGANKQK